MPGIIVDPTTPPTSPQTEDQYIDEDAQGGAGQKYLALHVPDFPGTGTGLHSYLCLGSAPSWFADVNPSTTPGNGTDPSHYGQGLANLVRGFADDTRDPTKRNTFGGTYDPTLLPVQTVDDQGGGEGTTSTGTKFSSNQTPPPPNPLMQNESTLLQTKGGWRDHSDGNRITTTYGDKVEVVRGNYKLIVMGRQDFPLSSEAAPVGSQVAGWDISGGVVTSNPADLLYPTYDNPNDPGGGSGLSPSVQYGGQTALMQQYTWEKDSDGVWGWTLLSQTGVYAPSSTSAKNQNLGNGRTISYTWVDEIYTYTGSGFPSALQSAEQNSPPTAGPGSSDPDDGVGNNPYPVKNLYTKAWGETIVQEVHAVKAVNSGTSPSITQLLESDGALTSTVKSTGGDVTNNMNSSGPLTNITTGSNIITESWTTPSMHSMIDLAGALVNDWTFAPIIFEIKSLIHADLHAGIHVDFHLGMHLDFHCLVHVEWHSAPALHIEIADGSYHNVDMDLHMLEGRVTNVETELSNSGSRLDMAMTSTLMTGLHLVMPTPPPPPPIIVWPVTWGGMP